MLTRTAAADVSLRALTFWGSLTVTSDRWFLVCTRDDPLVANLTPSGTKIQTVSLTPKNQYLYSRNNYNHIFMTLQSYIPSRVVSYRGSACGTGGSTLHCPRWIIILYTLGTVA